MNVPKLRFSEFNGEWEEKKIANVLKIGSGKDYKHLQSGDIPVFGTGGYMTSVNECLYDGESVCIGRKGTIDKPMYFNGKFWTVDTLFYTHSFNLSIPKFVYLVFQNINWKQYSEASGVPSLSKNTIENIEINIPQITEQTKIATFLTSIDTKIDQLTKKQTFLKQYKKGVMQKLFSQELRFKADDGSEYSDWEEKTLGDIGKTYNGLTGKTAEDFGEGKPYIQYKQIFDNSKIDVTKFGHVDIKLGDKQNIAQYGDVFFTISSETPTEVGFASVLLDDIDEVYLNSFCFGFRAKSFNILNPIFAQFLFRSFMFRKKVVKLAQGSTRYNMSKIEFIKTLIKIPSFDEQTKIANFLTAIDTKIDLATKQLEATKQFKKALLQQMFV